MEQDIKCKKIVITGAANGIGAAIFLRLREEGAYPIKEKFLGKVRRWREKRDRKAG